MERSAGAIRMTEAIPAPLRVAGWVLLPGPLLAMLPDGPGQGAQLRSLIDVGVEKLGLGAGFAPLQFLALAWVAVAVVFWAQARSRGEGLGRKSGLVLIAALSSQAMVVLLLRAA